MCAFNKIFMIALTVGFELVSHSMDCSSTMNH